MKRLRRIIFNTVTALSLLLCVTTAGLWVGSYLTDIAVPKNGGSEFIQRLRISRGRVDFIYPTLPAGELVYWSHDTYGRKFGIGYLTRTYYAMDENHRIPNFDYAHDYTKWPDRFYYHWIALPCQKPFIATAILPLCWMLLKVVARFRAIPAGHCPTCNYDLRATPDRCPECGTVPARQNARVKRPWRIILYTAILSLLVFSLWAVTTTLRSGNMATTVALLSNLIVLGIPLTILATTYHFESRRRLRRLGPLKRACPNAVRIFPKRVRRVPNRALSVLKWSNAVR